MKEMMSRKGIVFDIKQLAVFDGPGIRTTVFLKGCPMRCQWCHNPEGLSVKPELMVSQNGCLHCKKCEDICKSPENCILCGDCVRACPLHLRKICGTAMDAKELARKLRKDKDFFEANEGGITISGGEPTMQPEFLLELLQELKGIHRAIETCGYCDEAIFREILGHLELVIMDIKLVDDTLHQHYTRRSNQKILKNLQQVKDSGLPFLIRVPLIPGVNDTEQNLRDTAELLKGSKNLIRVELLPYHQTAGAKYSMVGKEYAPEFDPGQAVHARTEIFEKVGICCKVL